MNDRQWNSGSVLVVDDVESHLQILVDTLGDEFDVLAGNSGEEALSLARLHVPDLILLDVLMPDVDGYEVCRRLKADEATRDIQVIFITVMSEVNHEQQGLELGAVDYIRKPFSPAIVKARVRNHLALCRARRELAEQNAQLREAARFRQHVQEVMRHDLKNPLSAVLGLPGLILHEGGLTPRQVGWLDTIESAGQRMLEQINFSLDIFRLESGMYSPSFKCVDLVRIAQSVTQHQFSLRHERGVEVELLVDGDKEVEGRTLEVMGEEMLLYSLIANLLKNACEASPPESVITLALETSGPLLSVTNPGSVPADIRNRLFEKGVSVGKEGGRGLGTYSARLVAELHGGTIDADFTLTGRTRITCLFPRVDPSAEPSRKKVPPC